GLRPHHHALGAAHPDRRLHVEPDPLLLGVRPGPDHPADDRPVHPAGGDAALHLGPVQQPVGHLRGGGPLGRAAHRHHLLGDAAPARLGAHLRRGEGVAHPGAGPVDRRTTSSVGTSTWRAGASGFWSRSRRRWAATRPSSKTGTRTVVSGGATYTLRRSALTPTTETWPGTARPRSPAAWTAPQASRSSVAKKAVG